MLNSYIPILVLKEIAWFGLATFLYYVLSTCLFLLFESGGYQMYSDDPAVTVGGMTSIALFLTLLSLDVTLLLVASQRLKIESEKIIEWKQQAVQLSILKKIGFGVIAGVAVLAVAYVAELPLYWFFDEAEVLKSNWDGVENFGPVEKIFYFYFIVISGPIIEELYYREAMLGSIWRHGFQKFAIIFSSAFFGFIHYDFLHILSYLIAGVAFALLYVKTRSIGAAIFAHMTTNLIVYILTYAT
jgi:membrane protease YdiL (CAAX protease family)